MLVDPVALRDLELALMALDLWVWPIETAPVCTDGARMAFQVRRHGEHVRYRLGLGGIPRLSVPRDISA